MMSPILQCKTRHIFSSVGVPTASPLDNFASVAGAMPVASRRSMRDISTLRLVSPDRELQVHLSVPWIPRRGGDADRLGGNRQSTQHNRARHHTITVSVSEPYPRPSVVNQITDTHPISHSSAPDPHKATAIGRRKEEWRAFTSMFWMRHDQAPLRKHRIEDTPRGIVHATHLTYPAFVEDLVVFIQSQIRKIAYADGSFWEFHHPSAEAARTPLSLRVLPPTRLSPPSEDGC